MTTPPDRSSADRPADGTGGSQGLARRLASLEHRTSSAARYEVRREIGRGGMGTVHEAWDPDLHRSVAMKVLHARPNRDGDASIVVDRFLQEAQLTGQLEHPAIVPVYELGLDDEGRLYYTMPLVRGRTLTDVFGASRDGEALWPIDRVITILVRACEAIGYAHSKGVVHRDLKPSNVMVGRFGEVYVMDWGLSRALGRPDAHARALDEESLVTDRRAEREESPGSPLHTHDGQLLGTPAYMAPEQARATVELVGPSADVYSLGAMLYAFLVGHPPYRDGDGRGLDGHALVARVLAGPPTAVAELAPEAPPELVAVCERAMAREAEDRYATVDELADDLRAWLDGRVVRAYASGTWVELRKWVGRNRATAAWIGAAVGITLFGGLGFAWYQKGKNTELSAKNEALETQRAATQLAADVHAVGLLRSDLEEQGADAEGMRRMRRWLDVHDGVGERVGAYERALAAPTPHPLALAGGVGRAELRAALDEWRALRDERSDVARRLARVEELRERTIAGESEAWRRAAEEVAVSGLYGDLELVPQLGLVPLGANPATGLQEFWHVLSGDRPTWDDERGQWRVPAGAGVVLVLLPGGRCDVGSPEDEPFRELHEVRHEVVLDPFFLSKYELTQDQWLRAMHVGEPSYPAGTERAGAVTGPTNPMETVSCYAAEIYARRVGLALPTEEQWEYACRAGVDGPFHWGDVPDLEGRENLADDSYLAIGGQPHDDVVPWDDGWPLHSPVGAFEPNALGLFDMHGNVTEWTRSEYDRAFGTGGFQDGEALGNEGKNVLRGGNYMYGFGTARSAVRQAWPPDTKNQLIGLRPSRELER